MHQFKTLKWSVHAAPSRPDESSIGLMTLARPEALNAIDVRMRVELDLLLDQIRRDEQYLLRPTLRHNPTRRQW